MANKIIVQGWNSVSTDDKAKIEFILKSSGSITNDCMIEADPEKPEFSPTESFAEPESWWTKVRGDICRAGCDAAASAAVAACTGIRGCCLHTCSRSC
jgi:hypothetical protein